MIAQLDAAYARARPGKVAERIASWALFEGRPVTTRGRWINRVVFANLQLLRRLPGARPVRRPVFIVGVGRSGTTILGKVLSLHPRVAFLNEPKALWHVVHSGEDVIGSYARERGRFRLGADDADPETVERAHSLFGHYLRWTGRRRVLDKYPELVFRVPFVRAIFPDALFVLIVRNGWDLCESVRRWDARHASEVGGPRHDWWGVDGRKWSTLVDEVVGADPELRSSAEEIRAFARDEDRAAVEWIVTMREGLAWAERLPGAVRILRYEELAADPDSTVPGLLDFCGLESDPATLGYARTALSPRPRRAPAKLHPAIAPAFVRMMERLGYAP